MCRSGTTGVCAPGTSTSGLGSPRKVDGDLDFHWVPLVMTPIVGSGGRPGFPARGSPTGRAARAPTPDHWPGGGGGGSAGRQAAG